MNRPSRNTFYKTISFVLLAVLTLLTPLSRLSAAAAPESIPEDAVHIADIQDFMEFAKNCTSNSWSQNKIFVLDNDIDLSGTDFTSIPTFGGIFLGQGHTIRGLSLAGGSDYIGLFRYIQESGEVSQLSVSGIAVAEESHSGLALLAGCNYGIISNCSTSGNVTGGNQAAGIAGSNEVTGVITGCSSNGAICGSHLTGGIAGSNKGSIINSSNHSFVNTSAADNRIDLTDLDMDMAITDLLTTENAASVTDIGGIAGSNSGVIKACTNEGSIGYQHVGYNIGGIAGSQTGYIEGCVNYGLLNGRKDVGGIAGQMEPSSEMEYLEDTLHKLNAEFNKLHDLLTQLDKDASASSSNITGQVNNLMDSVEDAQHAIDEILSNAATHVEDFSNLTDLTMLPSPEPVSLDFLDEISLPAPSFHPITVSGNGIPTPSASPDQKEPEDNDNTGGNDSDNSQDSDSGTEDNDNSSGENNGSQGSSSDKNDNDSQYDETAFMTNKFPQKEEGEFVSKRLSAAVPSALPVYSIGAANPSQPADDNNSSARDDDTGDNNNADENGDSDSGNGDGGNGDGNEGGDGGNGGGDNEGGDGGNGGGNEGGDSGNGGGDEGGNGGGDEGDDNNNGDNDDNDNKDDDDKLPFPIPSALPGFNTFPVAGWPSEWPDFSIDREKVEKDINNVQQNIYQDASRVLEGIQNTIQDQASIVSSRIWAAQNSLSSSFSAIILDMRILNSMLNDENQILLNDIQAVIDELNVIGNIITDPQTTDPDDILTDVSDKDQLTDTTGKVMNCINNGEINGDVNTGGIAGTLSRENNLDPENDFDWDKNNATLNFRYKERIVVRECQNTGPVNGKRDCAGGIAGEMTLGSIIKCANSGSVKGDGSLVGGIAGYSASTIRSSSAKCSLSGKKQIGGIAGYGTNISDCYSMITIKDGESFLGSVAGEADPSGEISNNFFVEGCPAGIDGINYEEKAQPLSYEKFMESPDLPEMFNNIYLTFLADNKTVDRITLAYGETFDPGKLPSVPIKEGYVGKWDDFDQHSITYDQTIEAVYTEYISTLESSQTAGERPILLIEGQFTPDDTITLFEIDAYPPDAQTLAKCWEVSVSGAMAGPYTVRYLIPEDMENPRIELYENNAWHPIDTEKDGSYYIFTSEKAEFIFCCVDRNAPQNTGTVVIIVLGSALAGVLLIIIFCTKRKKKSK